MRRPSLRRRVFVLLAQWGALAGIGLLLLSWFSWRSLTDQKIEEHLALARAVAGGIDGSLATHRQEFERLASAIGSHGPPTIGALRDFRFRSPFHRAVYLLAADGSTPVIDPQEQRPASALVPDDRAAIVLLQGSSGTPLVVRMSVPVTGWAQPAWLVAELDPVRSTLGDPLRALGADHQREVLLIDAEGVVLARSADSPDGWSGADLAALGARLRAHGVHDPRRPGGAALADADRVLTVMAPLRFAPWGVVVRQPTAAALQSFRGLTQGLVAAGATLVLGGLLLWRGLSRQVVAPLGALSEQAASIRAGALDTPVRVEGVREIVALGETLDEARARLRQTLGALEASNQNLEAQVRQRTRSLAIQFENMRLLHQVAQLSAEIPDPARLIPALLAVIGRHYDLPALVLIGTGPGAAGARPMYVHPADQPPDWVGRNQPPAEWQRRPIAYGGEPIAELFVPGTVKIDPRVAEPLEAQIASSLHGAALWSRTLEQDEERRVLVRRLIDASEEERRRIARELHDETAQLLTAISLSLAGRPDEETTRSRELIARAQSEVHRIIDDLRPSPLDDLGLAAALSSYARSHLEPHGLEVTLSLDDGIDPPPEIATTVFRVFQEIVTNVLRHAAAGQVSVELYESAQRLILAVADDGRGFDPSQRTGRAGLVGMRERAELVGGTVRIESAPGAGTQVVLELPTSR